MSEYRITIEDQVRPEDVRALQEGINRHKIPFTQSTGGLPIAVLARDRNGALIGGAYGNVNWTWLYVSLVWVAEEFRSQGIGQRLMREVEKAAAARGCTRAHLDTFSFQGPQFYERLGYRVFGALTNYPPGYTRYYMEKALEH